MFNLLTPATVLAAAPFLEFVADHFFGWIFDGMSKEIVVKEMRDDPRQAVQDVGKNPAIFASIETFTDFRKDVGDTLKTSVVALLSLVLSQLEVTGSLLRSTVWHFALGAVIVIFVLFLFFQLSRGKIDPAKMKATKYYYWVGLVFCFLVIVITHLPKDYIFPHGSSSATEQTPRQ